MKKLKSGNTKPTKLIKNSGQFHLNKLKNRDTGQGKLVATSIKAKHEYRY